MIHGRHKRENYVWRNNVSTYFHTRRIGIHVHLLQIQISCCNAGHTAWQPVTACLFPPLSAEPQQSMRPACYVSCRRSAAGNNDVIWAWSYTGTRTHYRRVNLDKFTSAKLVLWHLQVQYRGQSSQQPATAPHLTSILYCSNSGAFLCRLRSNKFQISKMKHADGHTDGRTGRAHAKIAYQLNVTK
jgi:hypothetical protein